LSDNGKQIATKTDLEQLEKRLTENIGHLEDRLIETMRDMQTELLRGFAAHAEAVVIRMRKIEADQGNQDHALSGRVHILERRLLEIEKRLGIPADDPGAKT
jgi:hypothetical protein